jgi:Ca2+-binding EF-hand superfamily protein
MAGEQREFEQKLDVNKDGYLDDSEIRQWIAPNDDEFFNDEIDHLLNHIDENKVRKSFKAVFVSIILLHHNYYSEVVKSFMG